MQCDFDTIGVTGNGADIEVVLVINDLLVALGLERFTIHINNRLVLNGLLEDLGLAGKTKAVLIALDKLVKIGPDAVAAEMARAEVQAGQAERLLALAQTQGSNAEILDRLRREFGANVKAAEGIRRLEELLAVTVEAGVPAERLHLDLAIARGLDYYTGTVYETFLTDLPTIGSICSGGRYDDLAALYTKQQLPGVGASLGLDRLLSALEELKLLDARSTPVPVLLVQFSADQLGAYQTMARALRAKGIGVEVYPEGKKVGQQLQYAEKRGFRIALIAGPDEFTRGVWKIKVLASREEKTVPADQLAGTLLKILN
jgi:histidyl-tRNA synthetase